MRSNCGKILILVVFLLMASLGLSFKLSSTIKPDESQPAVYSDHLELLEDFGLLLRLPEGWAAVSTTQGASTFFDEKHKQTYVVIEPEDYFYHNPAADMLEDYVSSYRGRGIDVVIDSSTSAEVNGEPALLQIYRAGDIVDGELTSRSLASITRPSVRYVVRHPLSGRFLIFSGANDPTTLQALHKIVSGVEFVGI